MCGRYVITSHADALRALFCFDEHPPFPPRYNIAPTQPVPVVRVFEGRRELTLVRWGFIPGWVDDPRTFSLLFNARSDSVLERPAFRHAIRRRRCLFPADGFYEWKRDGNRNQPYFVHAADHQPLAFAGIWETWCGPNGEEVDTAAIITIDANARLQEVHSRMPAIVPQASFETWLDCVNVEAHVALNVLVAPPAEALACYEVSTAVNRAANDTPALIEPLRMPPAPIAAPVPNKRKRAEDDGQASLF